MQTVYARNHNIAQKYVKKGYVIEAIVYFVDNGAFSYTLKKVKR